MRSGKKVFLGVSFVALLIGSLLTLLGSPSQRGFLLMCFVFLFAYSMILTFNEYIGGG